MEENEEILLQEAAALSCSSPLTTVSPPTPWKLLS
jgi:hypothetical protein